MLRTTLLVAGKDLRQRLRGRSALVIAFIAPFVLAAIIGLAFGGDDAFRASYAVADADRGPVAAGFTDGVLASPGLRDLVTVREVDPGEAQAWAMDAFIALIARNAGLAGILRPLAVLAALAAALLALATWRLRRTLVGYALPRP